MIRINSRAVLNPFSVLLIFLLLHTILYFQFGEYFGDVLIDSSREVTVPMRINEGQRLYQDFHYEYGPLSPYLMAFLTKQLGDSLDIFRIIGVTNSIIVSLLIFSLCRLYVHRAYALLGAVSFIIIFSFHAAPINIFNFIFPYSYAAVFGITLLFSLLLTGYYLLCLRTACSLLSFLMLYLLCILTKMEIVFAATVYLLLIGAYLFYYAGIVKGNSASDRLIKMVYLLCTVAAMSIIICLLLVDDADYLYGEFLYLVMQNLTSPIGRFALGIDNLSVHAINALLAVAFIAAAIVLFFIIWRISRPMIRLLAFLFIETCLCAGIYLLGYNFIYHGTGPLLLLFILFFGRYIYSKAYSEKLPEDIAFLFISIVALAMTFRMVFNNTVDFYGFYLLVPAHVCLIIIALRYLPCVLPVKEVVNYRYTGMGLVLLFIPAMVSAIGMTYSVKMNKSKRLITDKGVIYVYENQYPALQLFVNDFNNHIGISETLIVLPEGYMLSYFHGVTPDSFNNSHIPDLSASFERELRIIAELHKKQFDYVLIVSRYTYEWGLPVLGRDYLKKTMQLIEQDYRPQVLYGDMPFRSLDAFGILVYKRKESD